MRNIRNFSDYIRESLDDPGYDLVQPSEYWTSTKKSDKFNSDEKEIIQDVASAYDLDTIEFNFGCSIKLELKSNKPSPHKILYQITIIKEEEEYYWVIFNSLKKVIEDEDEDYYRVDWWGLKNILEYLTKEIHTA
jgi:hypothetical protein